MKNKVVVLVLFSLLFTVACNPYKGFKGVNKKGMKYNSTPSEELYDNQKKSSKRMNRQYKREMKKRRKRMGTKD
jgi:hypothetical protein